MGLHKNITESELHVPGYIQASDPGAIGAGKLWVDTSGGPGNWVTKIRNATDADWEEVSGSGGGGGATDYPDLTSYKDLVTLQKSGAGYPSGANEAALYDGAGKQIIPRTAVRHWLDPDPDAIAGTWEFSTYGDANQAALETAGWTFENCTGAVTDGLLVLTASGASNPRRAYLTVSLSGDFFYTFTVFSPIGGPVNPYSYGGLMVGETGGNEGHHASLACIPAGRVHLYYGTTWSNPASGGTSNAAAVNNWPAICTLARISGTLSSGAGAVNRCFYDSARPTATAGWVENATTNTATTFTRLGFIMGQQGVAAAGDIIAFPFLRRYV